MNTHIILKQGEINFMSNSSSKNSALDLFISNNVSFTDQERLNKVALTLKNTDIPSRALSYRNSSLILQSGSSVILSISVSGDALRVDPYSLITLNKTRKKFPTLVGKGKYLDLSFIEFALLEPVITFIINCNSIQKHNSTINIYSQNKNSKKGSHVSAKQFKLPRKSTGS